VTDLEWWIIEQKTHSEIIELLRSESKERPWAKFFLYDNPLSPGNLNSTCRLEFVPFDRCVQDRLYLVDRSRNPEILAGCGITTQIYWDFNPDNLPDGWQGAVRQGYFDAKENHRLPNTQVALLAFTTQRFRGQGLSDKILSKMCSTAQSRGYRYLIVPALPPTQFQKEYVQSPIEDIADLKGKDGQYLDYWIRLHSRKGAKIIGSCAHSHRFAFSLNDFSKNVSSDTIDSTGEHIVRLDRDSMLGPNNKNMWQLVYADRERSFVVFDWKCVWVQYDLEALQFI
jgi:hypothetical protein